MASPMIWSLAMSSRTLSTCDACPTRAVKSEWKAEGTVTIQQRPSRPAAVAGLGNDPECLPKPRYLLLEYDSQANRDEVTLGGA
jgi:hypothetical protein